MVRERVAEHRTRRPGLRPVAGGLRLRLILSYSLVTLAALTTTGIVSAVTESSRGVLQVGQADVSTTLRKDAAAAPSSAGAGTLDPNAIRLGVVIPVLNDLSQHAGGRPLAVAVFDASGKLITADSCARRDDSPANPAACASAARAVVISLLASPVARTAVREVAIGQTNGQSVTGTAAHRGFVVAPLGAAGRQPRGALAVAFEGAVPSPAGQPFLMGFVSSLRANWPQNWIPVLLVTMLTGTGVGLLLSHQLVRRLQAMAATVRVWSHGDLEPTADARATDELGRLGADLNDMAEQIRNLLEARREVAMQQERNRVRRDLHDGVKQELFGISMQLATARESLRSGAGGIERYLEDAQRMGQHAQRELTAIIDELRPPLLRRGDITTALPELIAQFEQQSKIDAVLEVSCEVTLPEVYDDILFRVAQEALTNVRRHSAATQVTISLVLAEGKLRLTVADDGRGLRADLANSDGLGLTTMRQRAEALGGRFEIRTTSPGTRVEIVVPAPLPLPEDVS